jgi:hypothetical protein
LKILLVAEIWLTAVQQLANDLVDDIADELARALEDGKKGDGQGNEGRNSIRLKKSCIVKSLQHIGRVVALTERGRISSNAHHLSTPLLTRRFLCPYDLTIREARFAMSKFVLV